MNPRSFAHLDRPKPQPSIALLPPRRCRCCRMPRCYAAQARPLLPACLRADPHNAIFDPDSPGLLENQSALQRLTFSQAYAQPHEHQMITTRLEFHGLSWTNI